MGLTLRVTMLLFRHQQRAGDNKMTTKLHKQYEGCYRTDSVNGQFGQIKRIAAMRGRHAAPGTEWRVEIRDSETGNLRRYAGIWPTRREALRECAEVLGPAEQQFIAALGPCGK
jgi:hypothetical protein